MLVLDYLAPFLTGFIVISLTEHRVVVDGHSSKVHPVTSGVPQGSILGPLLFSIHLVSLTKIPLSQDTTLTLYADDTVLYIDPFPTAHIIDVFQSDVNKIDAWVKDAGLRLNANKPKVVVFSHKKSHPAVNIKVDNTAVPVTDSTYFLGVTITSAS